MLYQHHPYPVTRTPDHRQAETARLLADADLPRGRLHVRAIALAAVVLAVVATLLAATTQRASATPFTGNQVVHWNQIAEDTVVSSGAFQNEGLLYMAYTSAAVYDAVVAIEGGYEPYAGTIAALPTASVDAAVVEAAYRILTQYFPQQATTLQTYYEQSLAAIPDGGKSQGLDVGRIAAQQILGIREGDGLHRPIGTTSSFPLLPAGAGVWRLAPPAFAAPQTPWVGQMRPFLLPAADRFLPAAPPSLGSRKWADAFNETKLYGGTTGTFRSAEQTATAKFWSANVIRQYNRLFRDVAFSRGLDLLQSARLAAMVNVVGADAQIAVMNAKYHYLFWRPVTAIDPTAVTQDGYGPVPGFDDGNASTTEETGWRPLLGTPNHPEYPAAHGSITSAVAEVLARFLGTNKLALDVHGFDATGSVGNLDAVHHFEKADDLRDEIVDARVWAGLHYRSSGLAGVTLGKNVAKYDLTHAFRAVR
jgi:VCPO second helical-bundle domain